MKTNLLFSYLVIILLSGSISAQDTLRFSDSFDTYSDSQHLTEQSNDWKCWSYPNQPFSERAYISSSNYVSEPQSARFYTNSDIFYDFQEQTKGIHRIEFKISVIESYGAHINVQHDKGSRWAFNLRFLDTEQIEFNNGANSRIVSEYEWDQWHKISFVINIDEDILRVFLDDAEIAQYPFHHSISGGNSSMLDAINFWGENDEEDLNGSAFYIDDFEYEGILYEPPVAQIDVDQIISNSEDQNVTIANAGEQNLKVRIYPIYEESPGFDGPYMEGVITHSLADFPDAGRTGWSHEKEFQYLCRFYPKDLRPFLGLNIQSITTYVGDFKDDKASIFILDKGSELDLLQMGAPLFEMDFDSLDNQSLRDFEIPNTFQITGEEFAAGVKGLSDGLFSFTIPINYEEIAHDKQSRNYYYFNENYYNNYDPIFLKVNVAGYAWPDWLILSDYDAYLEQGNSMDINLNFDIEGLTIGYVYEAKLAFACNDPQAEFFEIPVSLDITINTKDQSKLAVMCYPNPASDVFNIRANENIESIQLYDVNGKLLLKRNDINSDLASIRLDVFKQKIYLVKIKTESETLIEKIISTK